MLKFCSLLIIIHFCCSFVWLWIFLYPWKLLVSISFPTKKQCEKGLQNSSNFNYKIMVLNTYFWYITFSFDFNLFSLTVSMVNSNMLFSIFFICQYVILNVIVHNCITKWEFLKKWKYIPTSKVYWLPIMHLSTYLRTYHTPANKRRGFYSKNCY